MRPLECLSGVLLMLVITASAQSKKGTIVRSGEENERQWQQHQQLDDIYRRMAASRMVVVGTAVGMELIAKRDARPAMDMDIAGELYTVKVEQRLCGQDMVAPNSAMVAEPKRELQLFAATEPYFQGVQPREELKVGTRYLLFLTVPDKKQQKLWTDNFALNPELVYYRGEEWSRGVVALTPPTDANPNPKQPDILAKVTKLCQAIEPLNVNDKLAALNRLMASDDPILRKEAKEAMIAIQSHH